MIDAGDIHLADANDERRQHVVVLSNATFHRAARRALVAPETPADVDEILDPWRVRIGERVYAVDRLRSLPIDRVLDRVDRAPGAAVAQLRRALRAIT